MLQYQGFPDDAYLVEAEDIWLTFEGAGQWTGFQWQIHPRGAAQSPADLGGVILLDGACYDATEQRAFLQAQIGGAIASPAPPASVARTRASSSSGDS